MCFLRPACPLSSAPVDVLVECVHPLNGDVFWFTAHIAALSLKEVGLSFMFTLVGLAVGYCARAPGNHFVRCMGRWSRDMPLQKAQNVAKWSPPSLAPFSLKHLILLEGKQGRRRVWGAQGQDRALCRTTQKEA